MTDLLQKPSSPQPPPSLPSSTESPNATPSRRLFDPSRAIGIIKRKALIKDLAAVYQAECLSYCQQLLELQRNCEEVYPGIKVATESRKEAAMRPPKRIKKSH